MTANNAINADGLGQCLCNEKWGQRTISLVTDSW